MKTTRHFFLLFFLFTNLSANAADKAYVNFDLAAAHDHEAGRYLRQAFDDRLKIYSSGDCYLDILKLKKRQIEMMKEKFVVLRVFDGPFGGYFLNIVIFSKKTPYKFYVWQVWIYDINGDNSGWEIRSIKESHIKKKDEGQFLPLSNKENLQYWQ
jgi:hypothetical protein